MARRRKHGEGGISQRADGLWVASVSLGTRPDGTRNRKTVYGATRDEAAAKLRELKGVVADPVVANLTNETFGQYLDRWLAARRPSLKPNTYACYDNTVRNHIVPALGSVPLRDLAAGHVQHLLATSQVIDAKTGRPHRSRRMVQLIRVVLRLALDHEGHWNRITAGLSRLALAVPAPVRKTTAWDGEQAARFLTAARDDDYAALWLLALTTGMRQGELLGLQWSDIDFRAKTITVQHNLVEIDGKFVSLDTPKTEAGVRVIELTDPTVAALRRHQARLLERGLTGVPQVFPSRHAKTAPTTWPAAGAGYLHKNRVRKACARIIAQAGVPELTFHELRHTAGTLMLKAGVDIKIVSYRLGHASVQITMDLYQHVLPTMQFEGAAKLDAVLGLAAKE